MCTVCSVTVSLYFTWETWNSFYRWRWQECLQHSEQEHHLFFWSDNAYTDQRNNVLTYGIFVLSRPGEITVAVGKNQDFLSFSCVWFQNILLCHHPVVVSGTASVHTGVARAANDDYFHDWFVKDASQFPRGQSDTFLWLLLPNQQPKTHRLLSLLSWIT